MQVIVSVAGFYGGTWYEESLKPQVMPDLVAKQFLPPHGDQLALPVTVKTEGKPATRPLFKATPEKKGS